MKSKITLLFIPIFFLSVELFAQLHFDWAISQGSKVSDFPGTMESDDAGNLYSICVFPDTVDLDPGPGIDLAIPTSSSTFVLSKFDGGREYQWGLRFYGGGQVSGFLGEIKYNRIRLQLTYTDSLVYQFHGNSTTLHVEPGKNSCFLNLNLDGTIQDAYYFPTPDNYYLSNLITLPNGHTVLAGSIYGVLSFAPGSPLTVQSKGGADAFLAELDENYQPLWVKTIGSAKEEYIESIYLLHNDEIYFAMTHTDSITISTALGDKVFPSNGEDNGLYGYATLDGNIQNIFAFGGPQGDQLRGIVADESRNMYICGYFDSTVNFAHPLQTPVEYTDLEEGDGFVAKYDHDGQLIWVKIYTNTNYGGVYTINLERGNELYLSGSYSLRADLDPGPDSIPVETNYRSDVFISKLSTDGDLVWSYAFPGTEYEGARAMNVSTTDSRVTLTGYFGTDMDCDVSSDTFLLNSAGGSDAFLMSFTEDNVITATTSEIANSILLYPNPTSGNIHIDSEADITNISLQSMEGITIRNWKSDHAKQEALDVNNLPPGMYLLTIQSNEGQITKKIIKQ
jgi:hypothetical protein